jgi:hypothetical protein
MATRVLAAASAATHDRRTSRCRTALLGAAAGLALTIGVSAPASASAFGMQASAANAAPSTATASRICTIRATGFVRRGAANVVTSTATSCDSSTASRLSAAATSNVHVGYGCNGASFTSTCWYFDVPSPGCAGSSSWGWDTISQNNVLSSWEAVGTCSHGILYDLPVYGGTRITCYTCYSLGSMDNRTTSLKAFR